MHCRDLCQCIAVTMLLPATAQRHFSRRPNISVATFVRLRGEGDRHQFKRRFHMQLLNPGRDLRAHGAMIMTVDWNLSQTAQDTHSRLRTEEPFRANAPILGQRRRGVITSQLERG